MKTIALAIPFFNTSEYFLDCIKYALEDSFVCEIIVNDDCSEEKEYEELLSLVKGKEKVKVFRNEKNLGAFRNKYETVKKCTSEWVYLLDSDNHPFEETYQVIREIPDDHKNICYSPRKKFCKFEKREIPSEHDGYEITPDYNFKYDVIGVEESKDAIFKKTKWFEWFINTGNYVINRQMYLDSLKDAYDNEETPLLHADTAAAYYFWLKNNGEFVVVDNLRHNHRLRLDSYWNACGPYSMKSVEYYKNKIINL
jgi:glycosyltransferase involved in cell wall biosynthesis